jgi:ACS family hexuronate transporter-like MFS transporter
MSPKRRGLLLALLIFSGILNYADRQIIAVLKPMLQDQLQWTDGDYGRLTALFQLAAAFAYLGAGWIVDRLGWRRANIAAVSSWSLAAMAHAVARTMGQFTVARIALGATESLGTPTSIKTIATLFEARGRSAALGAMNAASNIGAIITPLFVPTLAVTLGWEAAFLITGGLGLVWVAAWLLAVAGQAEEGGAVHSPVAANTPRPAGADRASAAANAPPPAGAPSSAVTRASAPAEPLPPNGQPIWRTVLSDRRTWAIAGAKVLTDQVWWLLLFWAPDFFHREFNLDMQGFAVPVAIIYFTAAVGSLTGGWASGRLIANGMSVPEARKTIMLVSALLVTPVPLALLVDNYWIAVALLSLTLAAHQGFSVNLFALTTDVTPSSRVGTVISVAALFGNLSGMVVLQCAGWLIGGGYGYGPLFGLAAVAYLLALAWVRWLIPKGWPEGGLHSTLAK